MVGRKGGRVPTKDVDGDGMSMSMSLRDAREDGQGVGGDDAELGGVGGKGVKKTEIDREMSVPDRAG